MRKLALGLVLCGLGNSALAISNPNLKPAFADLTWYANKSAVKQQMLKKGYTFDGEVPSNGAIDAVYTGTLLGIPVTIRHWFNNNNQLVKTNVIFRNSYDTDLYKRWNTVKSNIDSKYGLGVDYSDVNKQSVSKYSLELQLGSGKSVGNIWLFPTYKYGIVLEIDQPYTNNNEYFVTLAYESPNWERELNRRNQSSDF